MVNPSGAMMKSAFCISMGPFKTFTNRKLAESQLEEYQQGLQNLVKERTAQLSFANSQLKTRDFDPCQR